ncbi:MAG: ABC transporter ATP-binding protein/permease [Oscillospiraceae bacterium]|nr:ABC transporter ATP-binding protein/permease [Oscillospiraceae bacterium]
MVKLVKYLKPYAFGIILVLALLFGQAMCDLYLPNLMSRIIDGGVLAGRTDYILSTGLRMLFFAFLSGLAPVGVSFFGGRIAAGAAMALRRDIFAKVLSFTNAEFDKLSTASLITRSTNDVTQVQMLLLMGMGGLCYAPVMGIGGFIMAMNKSPSMGWIIGLAVLALLMAITVAYLLAAPRFELIQKLVDKLNLVSRENLSGMMVIRAFGTREYEENRFDTANKDVTKINLFINRVMVTVFPVINVIFSGTSILVIWVGSRQAASANIQIGDMMAFMQYAMQVIMSFMFIAVIFAAFVPRAAVSGARIAEVLTTESSVKDPESPKNFAPSQKGLVEFVNVSFRYHNADAYTLRDLSFTAKPGEMTAIIGPTGSGKSTAANLLMRFYDVTEGRITVEGADVREVLQHDLRQRIGYVPQKGVLLSGTVESNLKYGDPGASDEWMEKSAEIAQILGFIDEKEDRFQSEISQSGANVSGGQRQRLAIARALVKKPGIFVFDDSFSALDFKTDTTLRRALKEHTSGSTVIVIAQRVGTIMNADQILVLDKGRLVGRGTHGELLKTCPEYYEIASSQLSGEELGV